MRKKVFLFDAIKSNNMGTESVSNLLLNWFPMFASKLPSQNNLLLPTESRLMNELEKEYFELDINFFENITTSHRFLYQNNVYHSKGYNRLRKKGSDFVIKFAVDESNYSFACIHYFFKYDDIVLLAVKELRIESDILSNIKGLMSAQLLRLKNRGVFCDLFFHVKLSDDLIFIESKQILSKCIIFKITDRDFIVSEFCSQIEHD